jgi:hypothetical protein
MTLTAGLVLAICSAAALNWGWVAQHRAASALPPLALRRPLASLRALFATPVWLVGFLTGIGGWALYVAAVALAPLSLVQAVAAGSVGLIALFARRHGAAASRAQLAAIVLAIAGLLLLAVSLGSGGVHEHRPSGDALATWLVGSVVAATAVSCVPLAAGAGLGAASGILYAAGDVATKGAVTGLDRLVLVAVILAAHGAAFATLQLAFQRGSALASAGVSTLFTNAVPIAAGVALFRERLPSGGFGDARLVAFALVVAAAAVLARAGDGPEVAPA